MAEKVVIIGSGPAGWTAAIYAARANLQPLVFEGAVTQENSQKGTLPLGQLNLTTEVENFPGWPHTDVAALRAILKVRIATRSLCRTFTFLPRQKRSTRQTPGHWPRAHGIHAATGGQLWHADHHRRHRQSGFQKHPFTLTSMEGKTVESLTVVLAMVRANYLGLPSEDRFKNNGVSACAVCDGALPRFRNKPLVVIGGGDSAVEEGTYLTKFASTVYMVHRRDQLRASKIMQQRALTNSKITMKWNSQLDEVLGDDAKGVTGARLKSTKGDKTEQVDCAGVFLAIGHTPNTDFLGGQLELNDKGYIKWVKAARTNTSIEGVFAAGDVADDYYKQAITAAGTGCMAALDAERWLAEKGHH